MFALGGSQHTQRGLSAGCVGLWQEGHAVRLCQALECVRGWGTFPRGCVAVPTTAPAYPLLGAVLGAWHEGGARGLCLQNSWLKSYDLETPRRDRDVSGRKESQLPGTLPSGTHLPLASPPSRSSNNQHAPKQAKAWHPLPPHSVYLHGSANT